MSHEPDGGMLGEANYRALVLTDRSALDRTIIFAVYASESASWRSVVFTPIACFDCDYLAPSALDFRDHLEAVHVPTARAHL